MSADCSASSTRLSRPWPSRRRRSRCTTSKSRQSRSPELQSNMDPSQTFPPVLADSSLESQALLVAAEAPQGLSVIQSSAAAQSSPVAHRSSASTGVPTKGLNRLRLPNSNKGSSMNQVGEGLREHPLDGIDRMGTSTSSASTGSTRSTTSSTVGSLTSALPAALAVPMIQCPLMSRSVCVVR